MKYDSDNQRVYRISSVIKKEIAQIIQSEVNNKKKKNFVIKEYLVTKD